MYIPSFECFNYIIMMNLIFLYTTLPKEQLLDYSSSQIKLNKVQLERELV